MGVGGGVAPLLEQPAVLFQAPTPNHCSVTVERRPITAEDRRRAVEATMRRQWPNKVIRITEGMRRAIVGDPEYRSGRKVER